MIKKLKTPMISLLLFPCLLTSNMVAVSSGSCTTASDIWCEVMDLLTVFISDNTASSGSGICSQSDPILINAQNMSQFSVSNLHHSAIHSKILTYLLTAKMIPQMVVPVLACINCPAPPFCAALARRALLRIQLSQLNPPRGRVSIQLT